MLSFTAGETDAGRELLHVLRGDMRISATMVRRLKKSGGIFVNSRPTYTNYRLCAGDIVTCDLLSAETESDIVPEDSAVDIIFEDEWLLAANKPCGQLSHPSRARYTGTLANYVSGYLHGVCHAVNRLDRDTSGVVLFAKSAHAKSLAAQALKDGAVKEYTALVYGEPEKKSGVIDAPIIRLRELDMKRGVSPDGERAVTHYEALRSFECFGERVSVLKLRLETGRTHQIRVHCEHIGHPLIGDVLYFSEGSRALSQKLDISAQALHAGRLSFTHPFTGEHIVLCCKTRREELLKFFDEN